MAEDPIEDPANSFAAIDQEVAVPTEPADLIRLVDAADWEAVIAYVRANYIDLICNYFQTFAWVYRSIPAELVDNDPLMATGRDLFGRTYNLGSVVGQRLPDDTEELEGLGRHEEVRDILTVTTGQIVALRRQGLLQAAMGMVEKVDKIAEEVTRRNAESVEDVLGTLELQWAITRQLAGDLEGSIKPLARSFMAHMRRAIQFMGAISASHISLSYSMMGFNAEVHAWLKQREELPEIGGPIGALSHVPADVARALEALDRLDGPSAKAALKELEALHHSEEFWAFVAYAFAQYELVFGHPLEGLSRIDRPGILYGGDGKVRGDGISGFLMDAAAVDLHLAAGHGTRAEMILTSRGVGHPLWIIGTARLSLMTGAYDRAIVQAEDELWNPNSAPRTRAELSFIAAAALHLRGDTSSAVTELSRGVAIVEKHGLLRVLTSVPREILEKLARQVPSLTELLDNAAVKRARDLFPAEVEIVSLTEREAEVLQGINLGRSMREIAEALFVSVDTTRSHRQSLYRKLDAHSRDDVVIRAREWGLL